MNSKDDNYNFADADSFADSDREALLDVLEVRCQTNVAEVRERSRNAEQQLRTASIEILAGNACDRNGPLAEMVLSNLSELSASGISNRPIMVGSVYSVQLPTSIAPRGATLAVCDRCMMLGDTSYELRFRFPARLELTSTP
ncbi:MAG: hypothetical protein AB8H80_14170 [Planctomycetota bacterium]